MFDLPEPGSRLPLVVPRITAMATLVLLTLIAPLACSAPSDPQALSAIQSVTVDGQPWRVLVAGDDGMRGRDGFGEADGMLFDMEDDVPPSSVAFVMDGVTIPLGIAWFASDGTLVGQSRMEPCPAEPCERHVAPAPFRWAIEGPPGAFAELRPDARLDVTP